MLTKLVDEIQAAKERNQVLADLAGNVLSLWSLADRDPMAADLEELIKSVLSDESINADLRLANLRKRCGNQGLPRSQPLSKRQQETTVLVPLRVVAVLPENAYWSPIRLGSLQRSRCRNLSGLGVARGRNFLRLPLKHSSFLVG